MIYNPFLDLCKFIIELSSEMWFDVLSLFKLYYITYIFIINFYNASIINPYIYIFYLSLTFDLYSSSSLACTMADGCIVCIIHKEMHFKIYKNSQLLLLLSKQEWITIIKKRDI